MAIFNGTVEDILDATSSINNYKNRNFAKSLMGGLNETDNTYINWLKSYIGNIAHPIGSYYWSSNNTNPSTLFGGTWTQIKDRFVLAAGDGLGGVVPTQSQWDNNELNFSVKLEYIDDREEGTYESKTYTQNQISQDDGGSSNASTKMYIAKFDDYLPGTRSDGYDYGLCKMGVAYNYNGGQPFFECFWYTHGAAGWTRQEGDAFLGAIEILPKTTITITWDEGSTIIKGGISQRRRFYCQTVPKTSTEVGSTGGEAYHTLTQSQLPYTDGWFTVHTQESGTIFWKPHNNAGGSQTKKLTYKRSSDTVTDITHSLLNPGFAFGEDMPHNNMPPYIVAYCWRRIS